MLAKFGEIALDSLDRFELQTHLNDLADRLSQDRVKQAGSYMKSVFDEAIEQEFLMRDPTRKLKIPKNLWPKDKRVLSWEQLRSMLEQTGRRDMQCCRCRLNRAKVLNFGYQTLPNRSAWML